MFIRPDWPAPSHIKAICTTREGGVSLAPFDTFNLALHVGDNPDNVATNRQYLVEYANLPSEPLWLDQQHTDLSLEISETISNDLSSASLTQPPPVADASWTMKPHCVSVVMTADCLPVLITNKKGTLVSAIHAGWKGLQKGIVGKTIAEFSSKTDCSPNELLVWIGPAISANHFEVGQDVLDAFTSKDSLNKAFFNPIKAKEASQPPKYLADLVGLVTRELNLLGIKQVYGGNLCSYSQSELFYSYRRSGQTGRMASLIWIEPSL